MLDRIGLASHRVFCNWQVFLSAAALACLALNARASDPADATKVAADHAEKMAAGRDLFTKDIRQIFVDQCLKCHGGDKTRSGLDLATRESLLKGGDNGPAVILGKGKESRLYKLIAHLEDPHMPSKGNKLSDKQIAAIVQWIDLGPPYDKGLL